jgi:3-(3-hydroxy-phenyl)propionate hydroxylase
VDPVHDVAIVGFGPSGAVAAGLLGQAGLTTYVCDRARDVYPKPRAIALDHEVMRVFQQLGVVRDVERWVEPFTPSEYFGVDGQLIRRMTMLSPPHPQGYVPSLVFTQPEVERILRERAAGWPNVTVELGTTLRALEQDATGVTLTLDADDGRESHVRARYVIGCDGASSTVRGLVGIPLEDLDFDEPWLVVDVRVNERGLAKLPQTSVQYCEPDRPCTLVIGPGNHRRWEISLHADEDPGEAATPARTWALLSRWITPDDGELWRQASYRFHALVAREWRRGRVLVAGDAAHQQPPFLGQGMCQGIRDVANLAWKLRAVVNGDVSGSAAERLLDSYGVERKVHVRELTTRIKSIGAVVGERDEVRARARDARLLAECGGVVADTPRQDVLPRLSEGLLAAQESTANGTLFPQPRMATREGTTLMDERFGHGWRLVVDTALARTAARRMTDERDLALVVLGSDDATECDGVAASWMQRHACHAALVRPDHYVYGVARDEDALADLLDDWRRALGRAIDRTTVAHDTTREEA